MFYSRILSYHPISLFSARDVRVVILEFDAFTKLWLGLCGSCVINFLHSNLYCICYNLDTGRLRLETFSLARV